MSHSTCRREDLPWHYFLRFLRGLAWLFPWPPASELLSLLQHVYKRPTLELVDQQDTGAATRKYYAGLPQLSVRVECSITSEICCGAAALERYRLDRDLLSANHQTIARLQDVRAVSLDHARRAAALGFRVSPAK